MALPHLISFKPATATYYCMPPATMALGIPALVQIPASKVPCHRRNSAVSEVSMQLCRSLSKSSSLYMARNTEHDAPYWRGPIWFNINFLTLRALHHYSSSRGPHAALAQRLHDELRRNLLENLVSRGVAGAEPPAAMAPVKGGPVVLGGMLKAHGMLAR